MSLAIQGRDIVFLAIIFRNVIPSVGNPPPSAEPSFVGVFSFSGFFLTPKFERIRAEKISSPPKVLLTIFSF
jgi:hypothetical protein